MESNGWPTVPGTLGTAPCRVVRQSPSGCSSSRALPLVRRLSGWHTERRLEGKRRRLLEEFPRLPHLQCAWSGLCYSIQAKHLLRMVSPSQSASYAQVHNCAAGVPQSHSGSTLTPWTGNQGWTGWLPMSCRLGERGSAALRSRYQGLMGRGRRARSQSSGLGTGPCGEGLSWRLSKRRPGGRRTRYPRSTATVFRRPEQR